MSDAASLEITLRRANERIIALAAELRHARAAGAADERARIVAMMRRKAKAHGRLARLRSSPRTRQWWDLDKAYEHECAELALEIMADRIERGAP